VLAFSPHGRLLASYGNDDTVRARCRKFSSYLLRERCSWRRRTGPGRVSAAGTPCPGARLAAGRERLPWPWSRV